MYTQNSERKEKKSSHKENRNAAYDVLIKNGKVIDGVFSKIKSWHLGRQIRKGKIPRGRRPLKSEEIVQAIDNTLSGCMAEIWGILSAKKIAADGTVTDYGVVSVKKITTAFRDYLVDSLQDSTTYPLDVFRYHAAGTDNTAEANTQTALGGEVESRALGTRTEGSSANIYETVGTVEFTATRTITEHGIFSASTGGTMMDRSVLSSSIGVESGDSIQFTYQATFNAEA